MHETNEEWCMKQNKFLMLSNTKNIKTFLHCIFMITNKE